jgi:hypothetical protein
MLGERDVVCVERDSVSEVKKRGDEQQAHTKAKRGLIATYVTSRVGSLGV